jgi:hypothetical protein
LHYTFDHDVIMPESNEKSPPAPLPPDDGCLRFADGSLCNCTHDWLNMFRGTDPQVARIHKELAKRWMISFVISEHKDAIATIIAVIMTLLAMLYAETGADAVKRLIALPAPIWIATWMFLDGLVD